VKYVRTSRVRRRRDRRWQPMRWQDVGRRLGISRVRAYQLGVRAEERFCELLAAEVREVFTAGEQGGANG